MFRALTVNTLISAAAFFVVSVIGLLLIPLLVSTYGLEAFGIITLLRLLLPTGILAILDLGFSETTTLAVAQARVDGSWHRAGAQITLLLVLGLGVGALVAFALIIGADFVNSIFNISPSYKESFTTAVRITGICLLVLFPSMVFEGVVKGFEAYRALRFVEVVSSLSYALAVILIVNAGLGYDAVYYAFLGSMLLKTVAMVTLSLRATRGQSVFVIRWNCQEWREVMKRCRLMSWNKALGALQTQAPPFLIGILITSAAVGIYDILVKLPRFIKSILGILNSALLPFAAKLDAADDTKRMHRLGQTGLLVVATISVPILFAGGAFSEPILRLWIGPELEGFWGWQGLMFIVPVMTVLVSFGGATLMTRTHVVASLNRLTTLQIVLQFGISFLLLNIWQERAFIFGQVAAMVITFFPQIRLIFREQELGKELARQLFGMAGVGSVFVLGIIGLGVPFWLPTIFGLGLALLLWTMALWGAIYAFVFSATQRARLMSLMLRWTQ
jgi:O-antigen/teichoic acid export membrane protein